MIANQFGLVTCAAYTRMSQSGHNQCLAQQNGVALPAKCNTVPSVPGSIMVRTAGFHPADPGSIPGQGESFLQQVPCFFFLHLLADITWLLSILHMQTSKTYTTWCWNHYNTKLLSMFLQCLYHSIGCASHTSVVLLVNTRTEPRTIYCQGNAGADNGS